MFYGIQIVTQNYINPAVDIVKKKGILSSETLNVTLLAVTNSAAESFIIVNSIFFGVSDIGIACVVQQAAFYALINQGKCQARFSQRFRNVLLDRSGGNIYRLVDRDQRDIFVAALSCNNYYFSPRQLGKAYWGHSFVFLLPRSHIADDVLSDLRGDNKEDFGSSDGNRRA